MPLLMYLMKTIGSDIIWEKRKKWIINKDIITGIMAYLSCQNIYFNFTVHSCTTSQDTAMEAIGNSTYSG